MTQDEMDRLDREVDAYFAGMGDYLPIQKMPNDDDDAHDVDLRDLESALHDEEKLTAFGRMIQGMA